MGKRISALDVLGEVRRALRILRRAERFMVQQERADKRAGQKRKAAFEALRRANADELAGARCPTPMAWRQGEGALAAQRALHKDGNVAVNVLLGEQG